MSRRYSGPIIVNGETRENWRWGINHPIGACSTATDEHGRQSNKHIIPLLEEIHADQLDVDGGIVEMNYV